MTFLSILMWFLFRSLYEVLLLFYCRGLYITVVHFSSESVAQYALFLLFDNVRRIWAHSLSASVNGSSPIRSRVYSGANIIRDLKMTIRSSDSKFQCCLQKSSAISLLGRSVHRHLYRRVATSSPSKHSLSLQINYSALMEYCCIFGRSFGLIANETLPLRRVFPQSLFRYFSKDVALR